MTQDAAGKPVRMEIADHIAVVTIDNPPVNAQSMETIYAITDCFDQISDLDDVRVAVLTGAGKMFSAGADLKNRPDLSAPGATWKRNRAVREVGYGIMECKKPVIAAVNGPALGAGLGIVACCDIVVVCPGPYEKWKMQRRNEWMVDKSHALTGYWNGTEGGTANCLQYAQKVGRELFLFNPGT